ncbi:MAG: insulinase family protein, partial [Candidatus Saccharicenans sp.]
SKLTKENQIKCEYYQGPSGASGLVAYLIPGLLSETYPMAYLLEKIIGEGPGSRLWPIRQISGLAYNLNSELELVGNQIVLIGYLETENKEAFSALGALKEPFNRLGQEGLNEQEIKQGKLIARNAYLRESFNRDRRINYLSQFLAAGLPLDFYNNFLNLLEELKPSALNHLICQTFSPENSYEVVIVKD